MNEKQAWILGRCVLLPWVTKHGYKLYRFNAVRKDLRSEVFDVDVFAKRPAVIRQFLSKPFTAEEVQKLNLKILAPVNTNPLELGVFVAPSVNRRF